MEIIQMLVKEMEQEANTTRKMLERIPNDKLDWKPHERSMTLRQLSTHIAELPSWIEMAVTTDELDFAKMDYKPTPVNDVKDLLSLHEKSFQAGKTMLSKTSLDKLDENWTMRNGDQIYSRLSKYEVIRMSLAQTIHHRAQLGVFLRLLDIPIPGSYGPSADETHF
ncbi:MAG: DinB family protein [Flavisolibacter sp.]